MNVWQECNRNGAVLFWEHNTNKRYTLPGFPVTGIVPCDHSVKVLSAKLLHYKSILFLLNNKQLTSIHGDTDVSLSNFCLLILTSLMMFF